VVEPAQPAEESGAMSIAKQGRAFLLMGFLQWIVDWVVTVLLSQGGIQLETANIVGRVCGAMLGFWLNGRITFANPHVTLGRKQLLRFLLAWLALTLISTVAISAVGRHATLQAAWLAKPVIEAVLAVASFFISRHWIYR
jgi:putative flippase GtrA